MSMKTWERKKNNQDINSCVLAALAVKAIEASPTFTCVMISLAHQCDNKKKDQGHAALSIEADYHRNSGGCGSSSHRLLGLQSSTTKTNLLKRLKHNQSIAQKCSKFAFLYSCLETDLCINRTCSSSCVCLRSQPIFRHF